MPDANPIRFRDLVGGTLKALVVDALPLLGATLLFACVFGALLGGVSLFMGDSADDMTSNVIGAILFLSVVFAFLGSPWFVSGVAAMLKGSTTQYASRLPLLVALAGAMGPVSALAWWMMGFANFYVHARYAPLGAMLMTQPDGWKSHGGPSAVTNPHTVSLFLTSWFMHAVYIFGGVFTIIFVGALRRTLDQTYGGGEVIAPSISFAYAMLFPLVFGAFQLVAYEKTIAHANQDAHPGW